MRPVTLLLSGVPQYVTLRDLSSNLDLLFNTNEIETFKIRDLPNRPHTNKRQIALDFRSGYDAMAAQEKLEGYKYALETGREYTLHAKINKFEEYSCTENMEYDSNWYGRDWMALTLIPNLAAQDMDRAHARLDAQLGLIEKQKLVVKKETELLNEKQKLNRKYGSMVSSLYEVPTPGSQPDCNEEQACTSETEGSPPKISRSTSREPSSCRPARSRSRSREFRGRVPHRHRSRERHSGYVLPRIGWWERTNTRHLRSQSRERRRSSINSRGRRSSSRDRRSSSRDRRSSSRDRRSSSRDRRSSSRDRRSSSRDRRSSSRERRGHRYPRYRKKSSRSSDIDRNRRSTSRERSVRARSRSKVWSARSRDSRSKERRSRSRERIRYRRSRSRDRTRRDARVSKSDGYRRGRRLRSPNRRTNQLAIMPRSPRGKSPSEWSVDHLKADTSTGNTTLKADITNKQPYIKVEKDAHTAKEANKKRNKQNKKRKKIDKLKKAEKSTSRVQALSKDIMILLVIVIDDVMDREKIRITASNKLSLIKVLDELVQKRLEPIMVKNNDDIEVLKKYKIKFPMERDSKIIQQLLDDILKLEEKVPEATVTVCPESEKSNGTGDNLDVDSGPAKQKCTTTNLTVESTDNGPQIKQEPTEEPIIIIDIDSAEKPVPRRPQFVVVIKVLLKKLNKVIKKNKLDGEIKAVELTHVLRHILRNMLKGQGFVPREEIIRRFREKYPEENDERFVRNVIRDIKGGKYPGLTGHIIEIEAPENDVPDEIVLIEKKYDVVTVLDSDDDDVDIKPIKQPSTPLQTPTAQHTEEQIAEVINLDCALFNPSQPTPGPSNVHVQTEASPEQTNPGFTNSCQDKPCSNTVQATHLDIPAEAKTSPTDPGQAMTVLANIDAAKNRLHMPELSSPARANTGLPSQAQTDSVNPDQARTDVPNQAHTSFANLSLALPYHVNASRTKKGPYNPVQAKTDPGNAEKGPNNASQAYKGPINPSQTKIGPNNPGQINSGSGNGQAMTVPGNPGQAKTGPGNPGQAKTTPVNTNQVTAGFANLSQAMTCPISSQAVSNKENQKKASLDNTIQNLERKVEETPAKDKNSPIEDSNDKVNINAIDNNNLKVTAITIFTSLNELIAKSKANETENVPNEIKKEIEIEEEELDESSLKLPDGPRVTAITIMTSDAELFSLGQEERKEVNEIKNENEVFYDAEDNFVNDIERVFDDANFCNSMQIERVEQNSVTEQFRGLNNSEQLSSVNNSEQLSSVNNSEQLSIVNNSEQFNSKTALPLTSRTGQDEEETIESIVKYVASLY